MLYANRASVGVARFEYRRLKLVVLQPTGQQLLSLDYDGAKLVQEGLISQERESRILYCKADFQNMDALMTFLVQNCCAEDSCINVNH